MKILFLCSTMGSGGAERTVAYLSSFFSDKGHDVEIVNISGELFYEVNTNHEEIELYDPDKSHPSYAGSFLAAITLFTKVFNEKPSVVTFNGKLSREATGILFAAAENAVYSNKERKNI